MNNSFFNNFYFLTKLTTTLVLFSAVLFLGYLLVKSYKVNNEESFIITIDDKIGYVGSDWILEEELLK